MPDHAELPQKLRTKIKLTSPEEKYEAAAAMAEPPEIGPDLRDELTFNIAKRANSLRKFSKAGLGGWRIEYFCGLKHVRNGTAFRACVELAGRIALGEAPAAIIAYTRMVDLNPRFKEHPSVDGDTYTAELKAAQPRPLGAPDPWWRWATSAVVRQARPATRERLSSHQHVGQSSGTERMAHGITRATVHNPPPAFVTGDAENAYNSTNRAFAYRAVKGVHPVLARAMTTMYAGPTMYVHRGEGRAPQFYETSTGGVQGDPLYLDIYCLTQAETVHWADVAIQAVHDGRLLGSPETELAGTQAQTVPPPAVWQAAQEWVRNNQLQVDAQATFVTSKFYVDDGVRAVHPHLVAAIPEIVRICGAPAGLSYKPEAWQAWSPVEITVPTGAVKLIPPSDGLVVVGAPAGAQLALAVLSEEVAVGSPTFQESLCRRAVKRVSEAATAVQKAVDAAACATVAPRDGLTVLLGSVARKAGYVQRVMPPQLSQPYAAQMRDTVYRAVGKVLGWSKAERRAACGQCALEVSDGGLSLDRHFEVGPFAYLASWLGADQGEQESPDAVIRRWATDESTLGEIVRDAYARCVKQDEGLPPNLAGLAERAESTQGDRGYTTLRDGKPRFHWQRFLTKGWTESMRKSWARSATAIDVHRVQAMAGSWVVSGGPNIRGVQVTQLSYRVAMRMRFGLRVDRAMPTAPERKCAHVTRAGKRCKKRLDKFGHHATACGDGGGWVARHNGIVRVLATELRSMGYDVREEAWVDDLMEQTKDGLKEARMDLVVQSAGGIFYMDVVCFHPFTGTGKKRTFATGGVPAAQEDRKRRRYPVTDPKTRRRNSMATLVPVAITSYGLLGESATCAFAILEADASKRRSECHRAKGHLARVATEAAIHGTARCVIRSYAPPDGQERAHLFGRAAS